MVFSNCESKMGDFEPDVDIDEKQAGFKLDKDSVSQTVRGALARYRDGPHMIAITCIIGTKYSCNPVQKSDYECNRDHNRDLV